MTTLRRLITLALLPGLLAACSGDDNGGGGNNPMNPPAGNQSPSATIFSPLDGAVFLDGQSVLLQGSASDAEDGSVASGSLTWVSDVDGPLGSGGAFTAHPTVGNHVITLTATDAGGLAGTASVAITVSPRVNASGTWTLDVESPERGTFSAELTLAQTNSSVSGTFLISNGESGTLSGTITGLAMHVTMTQTDPGDDILAMEATLDETGTMISGSFETINVINFPYAGTFTGHIN